MANEKTNLGQAGQAFLPSQTLYDNSIYKHKIEYYKVNESEPSSNIIISENLPTRRDQAYPKMSFLDSEHHNTGILTSLSCEPVLGQKMINYEQPNDGNCVKKFGKYQGIPDRSKKFCFEWL
jgi:hypothetical protein